MKNRKKARQVAIAAKEARQVAIAAKEARQVAIAAKGRQTSCYCS